AILLLSSLALQAQTASFEKPLEVGEPFQAGAATMNITPPIGSVMGNSYGINISEGIHDDLFAKALVFESGGVKGAFLALDFISIPYGIVVQTRKLIAEKTDIPSENVILTATHCHAGPQMNPPFLEAVGGEAEKKSLEYIKQLPEEIVRAIQMAEASLQPAKVSIGTFHEDKINFNRRFLMKDGSFRTNPGRLNPEIKRPMGPVDPLGSVVYFETLDSSPLAILVNFALHPAVVEGNQFSADFPGVVSQLMEKVFGKEMVTVFTNGNSGNINHIDVHKKSPLDRYEESYRIGTILAADILKSLSSLRPIDVNSLQVSTMEVELPVPSIDQKEVLWAKEIMGRYGKENPPKFADVVEAWRILDLHHDKMGEEFRPQYTTTVPLTKDGRAIKSEVQVMGLGNELALVGFPGDAFVELSLAVRLKSPFTYTIVCEQSGNGTISYVPDRKAFLEGGYEVNSARFSPGGGELLVDAVQQLLIDLYY
ncbi:MAG: neutral/alkaline non-lysosomal ceramidase N-terminal domain-containing protein, partial [Cyclobacteriaceae bacterium]